MILRLLSQVLERLCWLELEQLKQEREGEYLYEVSCVASERCFLLRSMDSFRLELSNPCVTPHMNTVSTGRYTVLDTFVCSWTPSFLLVKTYSETAHHHNPLKVGSLNKEGSCELGMAEDSIPHDGRVSLLTSGHPVRINLQAMIAVRVQLTSLDEWR